MQGGALQIAIVEGQYGQIKSQSSDAKLARLAQAFLAPLQSGSVIESSPLERLSLILDDFPGLKVTPILRPGQEVGTGDLDINVERTEPFTGEVGLDNQGNRYTGRDRVRFNLDVNSPFILGDQIILRSLLTDVQGMWMGTLGYSLPLGASGLRGNVSYAHTHYKLTGGDFSPKKQSGTADVASLGLSYPLIRSQRANLTLAGSWQDKQLRDSEGVNNTSTKKTSSVLPLSMNFDVRDDIGGGGITYGSASWTSGEVKLGSTLLANDQSAKTNGSFDKFNLDLARIQYLNHSVTLLGRFSAQMARKNLDSSEDFGLGGANGVRAYPSGEAYGDEGWITQIELRYSVESYAPFVFYDAGNITTNAKPWQDSVKNERKLAGAGFGLRYQRGQWSADAALAWRLEGGLPEADSQDQRKNGPQAWLNLAYKF
jgi:hemolysin activation/secretion protein